MFWSSLSRLFSALLSVSVEIRLPDWTKIYSSYEAKRDGLGEEDEDKKEQEIVRWALTWRLMLRRGAAGQTEKMTQPRKEKVPAFTEAPLLSFNSRPFFPPPQPLLKWHRQPQKKYISCLCGRVSHCLLLWTSVDFAPYIVCLPGSFPIAPSASLSASTCLSACHTVSMMTLMMAAVEMMTELALMPCIPQHTVVLIVFLLFYSSSNILYWFGPIYRHIPSSMNLLLQKETTYALFCIVNKQIIWCDEEIHGTKI